MAWNRPPKLFPQKPKMVEVLQQLRHWNLNPQHNHPCPSPDPRKRSVVEVFSNLQMPEYQANGECQVGWKNMEKLLSSDFGQMTDLATRLNQTEKFQVKGWNNAEKKSYSSKHFVRIALPTPNTGFSGKWLAFGFFSWLSMTSWASAVLANFSLSLGLSTCKNGTVARTCHRAGKRIQNTSRTFFPPKIWNECCLTQWALFPRAS